MVKIAMVTRKDGWTEQEDNNLKTLYKTGNQQQLMELMPSRTWGAIRRRAKQLGLYRGNYIPILSRLPVFNPSSIEAVWLACAVDCEGSISIRKNRFLPVISFCNTNREIVENFKRLTFQVAIVPNVRPPDKTIYRLAITNMAQNYVFLKAIQCFLITKQNQALHVLEFIEIEHERLKNHKKYGYGRTRRQMELFKEIKTLNKRGVQI